MAKSLFLLFLNPWIEYYLNIPNGREEQPFIFTLKDFTMTFTSVFTLYTISWIVSIFTLDMTSIDFCWGIGLAIQSFLYFIQSINYTGKLSFIKLIFG